ncbi:MAG: glycosyltransferase family 2 protein [Anaerolineaceae bacterium]
MSEFDISIIICTYNRCNDLRRCLESLQRQQGVSTETIVIDDCSSDASAEMVQTYFPEVRLFVNTRNLGPGYSRNIGITQARGEYLLFLDSDTQLPTAHTLSNFLIFFQRNPDTGTLGGEIRTNDIRHIHGRGIAADGNSKSRAIVNMDGNFAECDFLATCCCMVKKEHALRIGGFDPYYGFGSEDKDFGYRIKRLGLKNFVSADCAALHFHSPQGRSRDETYRYHKTRMRFVLKCYATHIALLAIASGFMAFLAFYIICPAKLMVLALQRKRIQSENVFGGFFIVKAIFENLVSYNHIKTTGLKDFLAASELGAFIDSKIKGEN